MKLVWAAVLLCCLAWPAKADEFEELVKEIRFLSGANTTSVVFLNAYLEGNRGLMTGFLKYELALEGKQTSDAKINDLLDKWHEAFLAAIPEAVMAFELQYARENFSLEELRHLREIFKDPVMQKLTGAGFPPGKWSSNWLAEVGRLNGSIMEQLEAADPDWWKLDSADDADPRLKDAEVLEFTKEWMKYRDFLEEYGEDRWSMLDLARGEFIIKDGEQCRMPGRVKAVKELQLAVISALRSEVTSIMAQADDDMLVLRNEAGIDIAITRQGLLETAYLAMRGDHVAMLYDYAYDADHQPQCDTLRAWADSQLAKAARVARTQGP